MILSTLDWGIIAILGLSVVFGFLVGFIRSILSVMVWVGSVIVSMVMGPALTQYFSMLTDNQTIQLWCSYGVVFVLSVLVGWIIKLILNLILIGRQRGGMDGLLGALFGLIRGILLVVVLMWFCLLCGMQQTALYKQSRLAPAFASMTNSIAALFPGATSAVQSVMSSARSGTQGLMNSASGIIPGAGSGGGSALSLGGGVGNSQVSGAMSAVQSGISQATSAVKSNLGSLK